MRISTTEDIRNEFIEKYARGEFRVGKYGKTVEIQNAHFLADRDWIIREPNYEYAAREIKWYESMSLNVNDIPGGPPKIWKQCADRNGNILSNYGWCIWSEENGSQYKHCIDRLIDDPRTREACMIYTRPSMQVDCNANGMHDFMCTYATQVFLNEVRTDIPTYQLDYTVFQRSCDAVFGYDNDCLWHRHVMSKLVNDLRLHGLSIILGDMIYNCGSIHVYSRHFKYLE